MMERLRVAVVHYHLRPGGVTRVVENAVRAVAPHGVDAVVLSGEALAQPSDALKNVRVVHGLGYSDSAAGRSVPDITSRLRAAARDALGGEADLWHIHNHSLGKNVALPAAVAHLASEGKRLLLQIHDFAEDGRPSDYRLLLDRIGGGDTAMLGAMLYPSAPHVHYAPINKRDPAFLTAAGLPRRQCHYLPNAVALDEDGASLPEETPATNERVFLYVTRAIRRKNLGEFLLWSALAREGDRFEVSRAPKNPAARPVYDRWVAFAESLDLPVEFEAGPRSGLSLKAMMARAHALVTTSVAEGFGMAFLEPWLVGRLLTGRNLPEITAGFESSGIDLSGLYPRLDVPLEWIGKDVLRARISDALAKSLSAYGRESTSDLVEGAMAAAVRGGCVDFGRLDEPFQEQVIRRAVNSTTDGSVLRPAALECGRDAHTLIENNRLAVLREFSLEKYGARLTEVYKAVMASEPAAPGALSAQELLNRFLAPERFSLLRTSLL